MHRTTIRIPFLALQLGVIVNGNQWDDGIAVLFNLSRLVVDC